LNYPEFNLHAPMGENGDGFHKTHNLLAENYLTLGDANLLVLGFAIAAKSTTNSARAKSGGPRHCLQKM
jgi:hypothetical protein